MLHVVEKNQRKDLKQAEEVRKEARCGRETVGRLFPNLLLLPLPRTCIGEKQGQGGLRGKREWNRRKTKSEQRPDRRSMHWAEDVVKKAQDSVKQNQTQIQIPHRKVERRWVL